jgi:hypothetical protein
MELKLPQRTLKIEIDCRSFSAAQVREFSRSRATHQFTLDEYASMSWLEGRRFEEIIGMRRFRLKRTPYVYASNVLKFINTALWGPCRADRRRPQRHAPARCGRACSGSTGNSNTL